jgi:AAA15 family ATPase/GTPase
LNAYFSAFNELTFILLFATVGANGSGKSNFFHGLMQEYSLDLFMPNTPAIRFVLNDMFQNLRSEDRVPFSMYGVFV